MNKTKEILKQILEKEPWLSSQGICEFHFKNNSAIDGISNYGKESTSYDFYDQLAADRHALLLYTDDFIKVCKWLTGIGKRKTINKKHSSYGLKHIAEKDIGYITNGTFIAGAIHCGFKYHICENSPNPCFNMSEKSLRDLGK
jgi:hypothetical protein